MTEAERIAAEEAKKREEQRQQAEEQARAGKESPSILEAILGFIKFLFGAFFGGQEAPNEEPETKPETPADRIRLGQLLLDAKAIPKWKQFQESHAGSKVELQSPVKGVSQVTSGFGHREAPTKGASHNHAGVDLGARSGGTQPDIVAAADGIVLFSGQKSGYGNTVIIGHADGRYTLYGHMTGAAMPAVGAEVKQGQQIGVMGASGTATGVHLHFEERKGTEAVTPRVNGQLLVAGARVEPAKANFAGLVNPSNYPTLPSASATSLPSPIVVGSKTSTLVGRAG